MMEKYSQLGKSQSILMASITLALLEYVYELCREFSSDCPILKEFPNVKERFNCLGLDYCVND